jgi:3-mercaptopropionate dioxygenase
MVFYNIGMKSRQRIKKTSGQRCLGNLVSAVRAVTQTGASWAETAALAADQLRLHLPGPDILTGEQRDGDPAGYCSFLLHAEPDGSFSVTVLVWRPGQVTPIHDHVTWCVFGVIQGIEREERYALLDDGWLEQDGVSVNAAGDVTSLTPPGDIHRVTNAGTQTAVSLHVYGTDISRLGSSVRKIYDLPVVSGMPR